MKYFVCAPLLLLLLAFTNPKDREALPPNCSVQFCIPVSTLTGDQAKVKFEFKSDIRYAAVTDSITMSYNGKLKTLYPDSTGHATLLLKAGKYKFQFYYNNDHYEVYSDSIEIKKRHLTGIAVQFHNSFVPTVTKKPVIYVYPDITRTINIKLDVKGELGFTYPHYNAATGWNFTANPDGTILSEGKSFDYLFWDVEVEVNMNTFDSKTGFVVDHDSLTSFLETKLTEMKLSPREKQDFITFWVPLMAKNDKHFIHFLFNDECNSFASLNISPKPDNVFRVQMIWSDASLVSAQNILEQKIESTNREGFSVVEWGGAEIETSNNKHRIKKS